MGLSWSPRSAVEGLELGDCLKQCDYQILTDSIATGTGTDSHAMFLFLIPLDHPGCGLRTVCSRPSSEKESDFAKVTQLTYRLLSQMFRSDSARSIVS